MPEGPEMKYLVTKLREQLLVPEEKELPPQLVSIVYINPRFSKYDKSNEYTPLLPCRVIEINHCGKHLYFRTKPSQETSSSEWYLIFSFGLTGHLQYSNTLPLTNCHTHLVLKFTTGYIAFHDLRHIGDITITNEIERLYHKIGPDIMDSSLDDMVFVEKIQQHSRKNITVVLMTQEIIAGCGNYLKNEALYRCDINPFLKVKDLDQNKLIELIHVMRQLAQDSYERQLNGEWHYETKETNPNWNNWLLVYRKTIDRNGNPVQNGKTPDGRTTYYVRGT